MSGEKECDGCGSCALIEPMDLATIMDNLDHHCKEILSLTTGGFLIVKNNKPTKEEVSAIASLMQSVAGLRHSALSLIGAVQMVYEALNIEENNGGSDLMDIPGSGFGELMNAKWIWGYWALFTDDGRILVHDDGMMGPRLFEDENLAKMAAAMEVVPVTARQVTLTLE